MKALAIVVSAMVLLIALACRDNPSNQPATSSPLPQSIQVSPQSVSSSPERVRTTIGRAFPSITIPGGAYEMAYPDDDSNRLFVSSKDGRIFVFENRRDVGTIETFLDIRDRVHSRASETGLLGFAFDPDYVNNSYSYFYVHYNTRSSGNLQSVVSRFKVTGGDRDTADPESEKEILRFDQPRSNHNGGKIVFGNDGYLYISFGDGGRPPSNAQDRTNLFGSILRIDVSPNDDPTPYSIPVDNPFVSAGNDVRGEIWAYGLRNVWRFSFDRETGGLWAADVGQDSYEEVNIIEKGRNYGWPTMEGFNCYQDANCDSEGLEPPVAVYENTPGVYRGDCSITGGYVYRGSRLSSLAGSYIFGDYCSGKIWALRYDETGMTDNSELLVDSELNISSFGEDQHGEMYILTPEGNLYTLVQE